MIFGLLLDEFLGIINIIVTVIVALLGAYIAYRIAILERKSEKEKISYDKLLQKREDLASELGKMEKIINNSIDERKKQANKKPFEDQYFNFKTFSTKIKNYIPYDIYDDIGKLNKYFSSIKKVSHKRRQKRKKIFKEMKNKLLDKIDNHINQIE